MSPLDNKYTKWYNQLMANRRSNKLGKDIYTEAHHVIPKSLGGSNSAENIINLTAREHFIAHMLLSKMFKGNDRAKMNFAFHFMLVENNGKRYKPSSRLYESARKALALAYSDTRKGRTPWNKGVPRSDYVKNAVRQANLGRIAWNRGKERTIEEKQKISQKIYENRPANWQVHNKGVPAEKIICEHCRREIGGKTNYKRWHGDNCKQKT